MRIVHCIFSLTVGGAETLLVDILNEQVKTDDVTLVIVNDKYDSSLLATIDNRVRIIKYDRKEGSFPVGIFVRLNLGLRSMSPDIIHVHDHKLLGLIRGLDAKIVFTVHHLELKSEYLRKGISIIAISDAVRDDIHKSYPQMTDVTVIPNGINIESIKQRVARPQTTPFRIVNVARLTHQIKGQHILIEAVRKLKDMAYDVRADFIGDGKSLGFLKELADSLAVNGNMRFLGSRSREYIYANLADYDLMCHPSLNEGFGLTVVEGMAAMLPVVVSDEGGPYEIIGSGKRGGYFANGDAESCAASIREIIDNYSRALEVTGAARKYVVDNYSLEAMVKRYLEVYSSKIK